MNKPKRIQLERKAGWRLPENAVSVARPTKWGNRYKVVSHDDGYYVTTIEGEIVSPVIADEVEATKVAVALHRAYLIVHRVDVSELAGKDLACWCKLNAPCHADNYLELANEVHSDPWRLVTIYQDSAFPVDEEER